MVVNRVVADLDLYSYGRQGTGVETATVVTVTDIQTASTRKYYIVHYRHMVNENITL